MNQKTTSVMEPVINDMLTVQRKLNEVTIGKDWMDAQCDFHLAIQQECAEGIDHLAWKWWAKQQESIPAAQMEIVDVMHFVLSAELRAYLKENDGPDNGDFMGSLLQDFYSQNDEITVDSILFKPATLTSIQLFSLLSTMAGLGHTSFGLTCLIGERLQLSFLELSKLYRAKATLNLFRQHHGYRKGEYRKIWTITGYKDGQAQGTEDNHIMQGILAEVDWTSGEAAHMLYHKLDEIYAGVLKRQP